VVLAARTVVALQTLVARENDPQSPAVVTVGAINGGTRPNIIPDEVKLQLTVRSYAPEVRQRLLDGIRRVAEGEAVAAGMPKDRMPVVAITPEAPATFNTDKLTRQVADVLTVRFGRDRVIQIPPTMGGEDFSQYWMADKDIESTLFWLGAVKQSAYEAAKGDAQKLPSLHSSKFAPDPAPTIRAGVEAMSAAALSVLGTPKGGAAVAMLRRR
jgi:hippurate hydrolase